jgi:hypothetical protein
MMRLPLIIGLTALVATLVGCGPGSDSATGPNPRNDAIAAAPVTASTAAAPSATPAATQPFGIWFEPSRLSACGKPTTVVVHWDATPYAGVKAVEIIAVKQSGKETLFLSAGRAGSHDSGAWMKGGSQMILRNKADGKELSRATVESIPCGK